MNRILSVLGSMKTMAVLMLIFAVSIGYATFIENDFGTMSAKADVYNALWFEVLLGLLAVNLLLNIIRFKMARNGKWLVFLFHVSFLIILVGAAITRYVGYEGVMHIREGKSSDVIVSAEPYATFTVTKGEKSYTFNEPLYLSKRTSNDFERTLETEGEAIRVTLDEYIPDASYQAVADPAGKPFLDLMVTGAQGAQQIQLSEGEFVEAN
ncbi:MAG: cytochrome c biogenesis protein ResB, partial [Campylobacterales bacterium]|nr:cytochrome c biogenesis protein ResB [Campylobacterales bacterium]